MRRSKQAYSCTGRRGEIPYVANCKLHTVHYNFSYPFKNDRCDSCQKTLSHTRQYWVVRGLLVNHEMKQCERVQASVCSAKCAEDIVQGLRVEVAFLTGEKIQVEHHEVTEGTGG